MTDDKFTEGHDHNHATEQEAIACALQTITNNIGHDVQHRYPIKPDHKHLAIAVAAALLTLSAKYATLAGVHPIEWLEKQLTINKKAAEAVARAANASNN